MYMHMNGLGPRWTAATTFVYGLQVNRSDTEVPVLSSVSTPSAAWTNSATTITASAFDRQGQNSGGAAGTGVSRYEAWEGSTSRGGTVTGCTGVRPNYCPPTDGPRSFSVSVPNGSHTVDIYAVDALGKYSTKVSRTINYDGSAPAVPTYSGELHRLNGSTVAPGIYELELLNVTESGPSGINRVEVQTLVPGGSWTSAGNATLLNGRYIWSLPSSYATSSNRLVKVRARAVDNAGNASNYAAELSVTLRPTRSDPLSATNVTPWTHVYSYGAGDHQRPDAFFNAGLRQNNIDFVRMGFNMALAETTDPYVFDLSNFDTDVQLAAAQGMQIFPILIIQRAGFPGYPKTHADPPQGATELDRFGRFAAAVARRYGPIDPGDAGRGTFWKQGNPGYGLPYRPVMAWEVWNEPNSASPLFAGAGADPEYNSSPQYFTATEYKDVLATVEEHVRDGVNGQPAAQPTARIVFGGLDTGDNVPFGQEYSTYLSNAINAGAGGRFDAAAIHPYGMYPAVVAKMNITRGVLNATSSTSDTQIWPNEFGMAVGAPISDPFTQTDPYANANYTIPCGAQQLPQCWTDQANAVNAIMSDFESRTDWNVGPVAWHSVRDHPLPLPAGGTKRWPQRTGLRTAYNNSEAAESVNRPAWHVYRTHGYERGARQLPLQH
jgi:hypothetical protein